MGMELKKIGVVGGGIMGAGIIQVISNGGFEVGFKELNQDLVEGTMARVNRIFNSAKDKGRISEKELREKIALVKGFTDDSFLDEVDLVIEAVPERIDLKKEIFKHLDKVCKPGTVLASNTSSLSISQLGGTTKKPTRVIGMHWFNPPHIMKLIEIVPGLETSQDNILALFDFCKALKKVLVKVKECAGFLVNRLLGAYVNEAIYLVMEGWPPQEIDDAAKSMGVPWAPSCLETWWVGIRYTTRTIPCSRNTEADSICLRF